MHTLIIREFVYYCDHRLYKSLIYPYYTIVTQKCGTFKEYKQRLATHKCGTLGQKSSPPQDENNMLQFGRKLEFFENFETPIFLVCFL